MRIGIHKIGLENHKFHHNTIFSENDKNGMYTEINLLMQLFREHGYFVKYVDVNNINEKYDIIFAFNGYSKGKSSLGNLRALTNELNYLLTDITYYYNRDKELKLVDNIFVQSNKNLFENKPNYNSKLYKLPIYETKFYKFNSKPFEARISKIIFGGSIRERKDDAKEFLINKPIVQTFLKFNENNDYRLPINIYKSLLSKYKYGLVLLNPLGDKIGNIPWRYYEYIVNDCITFVVDREGIILDKGSFLNVMSYEQLFERIMMIEKDKCLRETLLKKQRDKIKSSDFRGVDIIDSLLGGRK